MEKSTLFSVTLALASVLCAMSYASPADSFHYIHKMKIGHRSATAYVENCGQNPFNISWTPPVLQPRGLMTIYVNNYTAPFDFNGGFVNASISFHDDPEPFIGYAGDFECDKISDYIPCPMKKNSYFHGNKTIYNLHALSAYPGDYDAHVVVFNKHHQQMICAKAHVVIDN